ncbi:MAG: hypothetical protein GAK31_02064 [Stenotrophomonas maltophilia]|uniref:HTH cro/C1-type domain-containing protein n=1 Tax=Stenotrophomonas maltophilia TaxID=40324 RepID=A0A7V8FFG8_STEMA|nr:MAG: hypothetical protein GAK31_02064 [Stenotrophomonas maltophilia]
MTNRIGTTEVPGNRLGAYLRDRRARLDPAALGFPATRRRTPGLRREEVARRAHISPTWYTWLEQGRGGAPSAAVLERIASALLLTEVEREHLFLLGLGRAPEVRYQAGAGITPRLQRVLDALDPHPTLIHAATWDVVAWNRAATVMLVDYGSLPPQERNILRYIFLDPRARAAQYDWESVARFTVGAFRVDATRAGATEAITPFVEQMCRLSADFERLWRDNDVQGVHGEAIKHIRHPVLGPLAFEYSVFAVDARTDLSLVVYNPVASEDLQRIRALLG